MINLEQVKLLESKVTKAIGYIDKLTSENAALQKKEVELQARLATHQKRIDELEVLVTRFKEEQGKIEEAILSALDRFSEFEEGVEKSLWDKPRGGKPSSKDTSKPSGGKRSAEAAVSDNADDADGDDKANLEIPSEETSEGGENVSSDGESGVADPLDDTLEELPSTGATEEPQKNGELDIF